VTRIIGWLQRPAGDFLPRFAFFSPAEPLLAYVKVAVLAGLVLAMPVILSQLWGFARSGLTFRERWYGLAFVWWGSAQFLAGAAFAYYGLLPVSLRFLLSIGAGHFEPVLSIDTYLSFVTTLMFWCGLIFELPVVLLILSRIGIVTSEWLRQQRPYAMLALVIVSAIVTPTTDPVNLLLMATPLILLYELSILITRLAMPRRPDIPPQARRSTVA
jgi:sec-independent protein translocase protein TatC